MASGTSAQAAEQALGGGITFAYAYGNVGGNIRGLKQTGITFASEADRKAGKPIPLSERGNLANPDVRWSLAGYMAEGPAGRAAQQAEAMHKQGKSDAEIFAATGAIPGYNGRYWKVLDNAKTRLKTNYRTAVEQNRFNNEVLLGDIFEAKEIYEAYPAAKEISVDFWDSRVRSRGAYGAMTPQGTMMINLELSRPDTEMAIRHELQHWIQDQEGSENGSNQRTWTWIRNVTRNEQYGATTQSYMEALQKVDPTGAVGIAAVNNQIFNEDGSVVKSLLQKNVRAAAMDIDLDIRQELGRLDAARWKMRRLLFGDLSQMSDYELYLNTVGELEARHVQQTGEGQFVPISYGQAVSIEEYDDLARMETDFQIDLAAFDGKVTNTTKQKTKYSLAAYSSEEIARFSNSESILLYQSWDQLSSFVDEAAETLTSKKRIYLGKVDQKLAAEIKSNTGIDTLGYHVVLYANEVKKILKGHGTERTEKNRDQRPVTVEDIKQIKQIIEDNDEVRLDANDYHGDKIIKFSKQNGENSTVVTYKVDKKHLLHVQTMYIKKSLSPAVGAEAPSNTPEAAGSAALKSSI